MKTIIGERGGNPLRIERTTSTIKKYFLKSKCKSHYHYRKKKQKQTSKGKC